MRTVSFSEDQVNRMMDQNFVATYTNTQGDPSAGMSFSHAPGEQPGMCGRGAGRQNVQTIFMTPAGGIFHVACGFLSPQDLIEEMQFAATVFESMDWKDEPMSRRQLVSAQTNRLLDKGFSPQSMQSSHPLQKMMLSGPNPGDLGMKIPGGRNMFDEIASQRILEDGKYVLRNPLISREKFEQNPGDLVGHHKSFFGSNSAMNVFR
jgi:hypothetical protein